MSKLVMSHNGSRVYSSGCPAALSNVFDKLELSELSSYTFYPVILTSPTLAACEKSTFEYLRQQRTDHQLAQSQLAAAEDDEMSFVSQLPPARTPSLAPSQADSEDDDTAVEKWRIRLTSGSSYKDVVTHVKPTTPCSNIVLHYLKQVGLQNLKDAQKKKVRLVSDGLPLDLSMTAEEADLDDDVQIEVMGLPLS